MPVRSTRASAVIRRVLRSRPTTRRRSSSTSVPACVRTPVRCYRRVPRNGAAVASALGSRAGTSVLHAAAPRGLDRSTSSGRARTRVRSATCSPQMMRPPFFPITPEPADGRRALSRHRRRRLSRRRARRCGRVGCATSVRRSASASTCTACRSRTSPITVRAAAPTHSDDYIPHEVLELCDGVDVLDPRRAAHARGVRAEAPLGPLHRRLRGARRPRGGARAARAVPPRSRARRRRPRRRSNAIAPPTSRPGSAGPR